MVAAVSPGPADMPPKAPQIRCEGNQLTIAADNSTMSSVLAGVRACIGFEIQLPNGSGDERTYIHLGPGPVREVLDDLLLATDYNFVIQSSNSSPGRVTNVVLTARTNEASDSQDSRGPSLPTTLTMTPARRIWLASRNAARPAVTETDAMESTPVNEEPAAASAVESPVAATAEPKAEVAGTNASDIKEPLQPTETPVGTAAANTIPEGTSAPTPAAAPASAGVSEEKPAAKELQSQINQMQQLFEQRKRMTANQSAPSEP
jgi:hypothetical protein